MRKIILFLFVLTSILKADWEPVNSPVNFTINTVSFIYNQSTGYVGCLAGNIYKTTNGGTNWQFQNLGGGNGIDINDIFINPVNNNYVYAGGNDGVIHKTTNSGVNWSFVDLGTPGIRSIIFLDLLHGIAASYGNQMFVTSNGGDNWTTVSTGLFSENYWSGCYTSNAVYFSASAGKIVKSTNGGANWSIQTINEDAAIYSIFFKDVNTGYAGTSGGKVYQTTNGGSNWFLLSVLNPPIGIYCITSNGFDLYLCGNSGSIYKRPEGGSAWYLQTTNASVTLNDICFTGEFTGYTVGVNGLIRKTTNGGNPIGIEQISTEIPGNYALSQNYPNPFNPETNMEFAVPRNSYVKLVVYDNIGREVLLLVDAELSAGKYKVDFNAGSLPSGVYFYRLLTEEYSITKKMMLVK